MMNILLPDIAIFDNFCPAIDYVKASAMAAGFGTWRPNKGELGSSIYEGMGWGGHHSYMVHALTHALRCRVYPSSMFFRITPKGTERAYTHSDREAGSWTCVCYLSSHDEPSGTKFLRHRATGLTQMPTFEEMSGNEKYAQLKIDMIEGGEKEWEEVGYCGGSFNRAVVFNAPLFHARFPREGLGSTEENARLTWVAHFEIEPL